MSAPREDDCPTAPESKPVREAPARAAGSGNESIGVGADGAKDGPVTPAATSGGTDDRSGAAQEAIGAGEPHKPRATTKLERGPHMLGLFVFVLAFLIGVELLLAAGALHVSNVWYTLMLALPTVLALFPSADLCREIILAIIKRVPEPKRTKELMAIVCILVGILVMPILPCITLSIIANLAYPDHPSASIWLALQVAFNLCVLHGVLILRGAPGSLRALYRLWMGPQKKKPGSC